MAKTMQLQLQLFRAVVGREPGQKDPVFGDRSREKEGIFRVGPSQQEHGISSSLAQRRVARTPHGNFPRLPRGVTPAGARGRPRA
jgi:hypothetical protein